MSTNPPLTDEMVRSLSQMTRAQAQAIKKAAYIADDRPVMKLSLAMYKAIAAELFALENRASLQMDAMRALHRD